MPTRIEDEYAATAVIGEEKLASETMTEWKLEEAPCQVKLVDILQFVNLRKNISKPFPISIVISAWDCVQDQGLEPDEWLSKHLPLLWQYLKSTSRDL